MTGSQALTRTAQGWLVSYDVSSNRRRLKAADHLSAHGWRWFYSGFWLPGPQTSDNAIDGVLESVRQEVAPGDLVLAQRCCPRCLLRAFGSPIESPPPNVGLIR